MDIKPIETQYKGYRFRSRLEARWAVFFDAVGAKWEYEKEGYNLDGKYYLPDFSIGEFMGVKGSERVWWEIKPEINPGDRFDPDIMGNLAIATNQQTIIYFGYPDTGIGCIWTPDKNFYSGCSREIINLRLGMNKYNLKKAFAAAKSARFEHGESG